MYKKLQPIPIEYEDQDTYDICKGSIFNSFEKYRRTVTRFSPKQCVFAAYANDRDYYMDLNGMEKFVYMLAGVLYEIDNSDVDSDHLLATLRDIADFEKANYYTLFTEEDQLKIKADIETIKDFANHHPELLKV